MRRLKQIRIFSRNIVCFTREIVINYLFIYIKYIFMKLFRINYKITFRDNFLSKLFQKLH